MIDMEASTHSANRTRRGSVGCPRYAPGMTTIDLRALGLRPGELRRQAIDLELDPFLLGGQRYEAVPSTVPAQLEIADVSGGTVFELAFEALLAGPCMRCLAHAE